jgi:hypothetical protein
MLCISTDVQEAPVDVIQRSFIQYVPGSSCKITQSDSKLINVLVHRDLFLMRVSRNMICFGWWFNVSLQQ